MTNQTDSYIDTTLLRGLEPAMTDEERTKLTAMLISGDPDELAKAATVMYHMGDLLSQGIMPKGRTMEQSDLLKRSFHQSYNNSKLSSPLVVQDSEDNNEGGEEQGHEIVPQNSNDIPHHLNQYEKRVYEEKVALDVERKVRATALPLPVRMPRYTVVRAFDPVPASKKKPTLSFVDDPECNGTLGEAFTKITVKKRKGLLLCGGSNVRVDHSLKPSPGYDVIVGGSAGYETKISIQEQPVCNRVLIYNARKDAAKKGLHRGDVVTHVNGEVFTGTADELQALLKKHFDNGLDEFSFVVNAEPCIAEALKLRSAK